MGFVLFVLFVLFVTIVLVAIVIMLAHDEELGGAIVFGALALFVLLVLVFIVAPGELGYSQVPPRAEEFTRRLEVGKVYKLVATEPVNYENDGEKILLVSDEELSRHYYAIRVKVSAPIPERFTLINGVPREVAK